MEYGPLKIEYAYHTRILFFEEYVRILTYSIIAYAYARALVKAHLLFSKVLMSKVVIMSWRNNIVGMMENYN